MKNLTQHVDTIKEQIEEFDRILKEHAEETAIQAKYWSKKLGFEQLLEYLLAQQSPSNFSDKIKTNEHRQESGNFLVKQSSPRKQTIKIENAILEIIKKSPNGIDTKTIRKSLNGYHGLKNISNSKLANHLWKMHTKRGLLKNIKKGFYVIAGSQKEVGGEND
jgi:hypothetical protein